VQPPRTVFVKWPFGHPLGEPDNVKQQRAVVLEAFKALYAIKTPGEIVDLPFRWRRHDYDSYEEPGTFHPIKP
jgi:D-proline reductase (dithiol) PrdB